MFTVYILFSYSLNKFYVGSCSNFERRFHEHNSGQSKYTRAGMPWVLVIKFDVSSRKEAMTLERKIKKRGIQRFLDQAG
jgi:putative endonuclease